METDLYGILDLPIILYINTPFDPIEDYCYHNQVPCRVFNDKLRERLITIRALEILSLIHVIVLLLMYFVF